MSPTVNRLSAALGAEITDIDLAATDADSAVVIMDLLTEHQVLFFPGQSLNPDEHVLFGRLFGELEGHPNLSGKMSASGVELPGELFELAASRGGIADEWHADLTFMPRPSVMSILRMVSCPEVGGDTCWSNLYAVYEALSEPLQELCRGLTALHDARPHNKPEETHIHPVVRTHPVTGRSVLYVNEHFTRRIVELSAGESDALLGYLLTLIKEPRFIVRYRWTPGTVAIWDNRCTQHFVVNDFDGERIIQRVTVMGDEPCGENPRWQPWPQQAKLRRAATSQADRQLRVHLEASAEVLAPDRSGTQPVD